MPNRPTFIVIGAPKAGTTALYHFLKAHPQIYMSPIKETLFFRYTPEKLQHLATSRKHGIYSLAAYQALFDGITDEKAAGEASPQYFYSPIAAANIKKHLPGAKLVALLRHPVDRAYSQYMLHVNAGRAPYHTFEAHFRESLPHLASWNSMPYDCYGLGRSFYYESLKRYYDCFPREQIRVYRTDALNTDPASVLADLYGFLGVDSRFQPDLARRYNVGGGIPRNQVLHKLVVGQNRLKEPLKRIIPAAWWHRLYRLLMQQTRTPKQTLSPATRNEFFNVYREDVHRTQALTGLDLSAWFAPATPPRR